MFDYTTFYLPAVLALVIVIGFGARVAAAGFEAALARWRDRQTEHGRDVAERLSTLRLAGLTLGIGLFALPVFWRWQANDSHRDCSALRYARALAQALPAHALVFGEEDHYWFPLFYEKVVENALPDTLIFNLYETPRPESYRLFARFRSRGFTVLPVPAFGVPGHQRSDYDFLRSLFEANVIRRPVVLLAEEWVANEEEIKTIISPYYRAWHTNLPFIEFYPLPPRFQPQPGGGSPSTKFPDGTQLLQFSATYEPNRGVQWVHLRYRWSIAVKAPWETLAVETSLVDPRGNVQTTYDTPDIFHVALRDFHPIGYGYLPVILPGQPLVIDENEWIYVGQENAPRTYTLRMVFRRDNQIVKRPDGQENTVLGSIAIPPPPTPPVTR
jgi:hypothetical protein